MGLGAAADISLAKARDLAAAARQLLVEGIDPLEDRRAQEAAVVEAAREAKLEETGPLLFGPFADRSEEHTSELQSLMRSSYAVFCLKNKNKTTKEQTTM